MSTDEIQYVQVDSRDLLDVVNLASVPLEEDAPADAKFYLNEIRNRLWTYLTRDQRTSNVDHIADKEYLPPVNLILDK